MMHFTDLSGLLGIAFAIAVLIVPFAARVHGHAVLPYIAVCMLLTLLPFDGLSVAAYLRGLSGDLSMASLLLLTLALRRRMLFNTDEWAGRTEMLVLIVLAALVLYPLALGVGMFDSYRMGFGEVWFIAVLLLLVLIAWRRKNYLIALWISSAVLTWSLGWYESSNLWDYLIDPWVAIYAIAVSLRLMSGRIKRAI